MSGYRTLQIDGANGSISALWLDDTARRTSHVTSGACAGGLSDLLSLESPHVPSSRRRRGKSQVEGMSHKELEELVITLEEEMYIAAEELRFEYAAKLRDEIKELRRELTALAEV